MELHFIDTNKLWQPHKLPGSTFHTAFPWCSRNFMCTVPCTDSTVIDYWRRVDTLTKPDSHNNFFPLTADFSSQRRASDIHGQPWHRLDTKQVSTAADNPHLPSNVKFMISCSLLYFNELHFATNFMYLFENNEATDPQPDLEDEDISDNFFYQSTDDVPLSKVPSPQMLA